MKQCPFVRWRESDYDVVSGYSSYEAICASLDNKNKPCCCFWSKFCKYRRFQDNEDADDNEA